MGKPVNAYLAKMQAQHAKDLQDTATLMKIWAIQAMTDAIMLGLMYGGAVYGKSMSWEQAYKTCGAILDTYEEIIQPGITSEPDADAYRAKADKLLADKIPPEYMIPWEKRYPHWEGMTVEQERERYLTAWRRRGYVMRDSVTGKIMNQLGEEEHHGGQDDQSDRGSAE